MNDIAEPVLIQTFIAKSSVKALNKSVLGWLVTASAFRRRGYCEAIMDALLTYSANRGVLATTQHPGIREKLLRKGFVQRGRSWPAADGGGLNLYLRSHHDK